MSARRRQSRLLADAEDPRRAFLAEEDDAGPVIDPAEEAYARGREEGLAEGRRLAMEETEPVLEAQRQEVAGALRQIADLEQAITREHEARLLQITLEAASRVVRERIQDGDPVATRALREAMESLPESAKLSVRMHPDDLAHAEKTLADELSRGRVVLEGDPALSRGGCSVETATGIVDATLETAEDAVRQAAAGDPEGA